MNWAVFTATFAAVFAAELADKTQLVGIAMSSKTGRPISVWLGSVAAYMLVTVISVFLGAVLGKFIRPEVVKAAGASIFVVMGVLMLMGKL